METNQVLKEASRRIYEAVKDMAGTEKAAGDFGRGAGGDISRNIDITAETTVLDYLKEINFECVVLGEECGRVELSDNPKGFIIMDAIDGSANAVRGVPFFCSSLAFATENRLSSITDGVITNLSTGEMYSASEGKGAFLDDKQISVYKGTPLYKIVGVNTSGASQEIMKKLQPVFEHHSHTRHFGANALEMAMFAQGLMDVSIDLRDKINGFSGSTGIQASLSADKSHIDLKSPDGYDILIDNFDIINDCKVPSITLDLIQLVRGKCIIFHYINNLAGPYLICILVNSMMMIYACIGFICNFCAGLYDFLTPKPIFYISCSRIKWKFFPS